MKKFILFLGFTLLVSNFIYCQTPNGFLNFGTTADGTTATTANTGFGGVRVGTGGGGFVLKNPGQSIGTDAELRGIAPTGGSINSVGITSTEFGTAATTFTVSFEVYFSGGSSGTWYFFAGSGASFAAAQSSGFTSAQVFSGIRWVYGASDAITTSNRAGAAWNTTGITGTPFAQNSAYFVTIVGNNSASTVNYGASESVAANSLDLWVNGILVGNDLAKGALPATTNINAFRFYSENSAGNVATIALDNIRWYNTCVLPPTHLAFVGVPASGFTGTNLAGFTVEARSGSLTGPVATAFSGNVTLAKASGSGNISGTLSPPASSGVAPYNDVKFDAPDTYTMSASASDPVIGTTSGNVVINNASTPVISVGSIGGFGNQAINTTSAEKMYLVSGSNLTANIIVKPPSNFEISISSGAGFIASPDSIVLTQIGGTFVADTIFVRFKPTALTFYSGNITHTSTGATSQNVVCSGTGVSPANPVPFTAVASSASQIDLSATTNGDGDNIVVVYNGTGTFTAPVDGVVAGNPGDALAGGTIWYKGTAASLTNHTGLSEGLAVYYKAFSFDALNFYSAGIAASATTFKGEPTNYPSSFSAVQGTPSYSVIQVSWTDATGGTVPDGYLIKGSSVDYGSIADPVDGTAESNSTLVRNVTAGVGSYSFTGLAISTTYYFKIYPYTNSLTNINYKADGTVPSSSASTTAMPWIEDFEAGYKSGYTLGPDTCTKGIWIMDEALNGNLAGDHKNGLRAVRMRNSSGSLYMTFDKFNGAGTVTVYHSKYGSTDGNSTWKLQKSTDGGSSWIDVGSTITTSTYTLSPQSFTINQPGNVRFKIIHVTGGATARLNIDDITITDFADPAVTTSITTGNWSDASIWDNGIPGDASNVVIASNTTVTLNDIDICNNLAVHPNAAFIINSGKNISVTQKFIIKSNAAGTGSLIDENTSSSINGTIEIERFVNPDRWTFISSPITNAISNIFLHAWLKDYNEQTCLWNNPNTATNTPLLTGKGFALWDTTTNGKTFVYSGTPNMGDITPSILSDTGFKLVGNPYTSAITWQDVNWIKTQIGATIYTWDGSNYVTWNGFTGNLINGIIPSGQAFFVYSSGTTPVLTIPKSARTNNTQAFYKSTIPDLLVFTADGNGYTDQTFINFNANATNSFDQLYDGYKLWGIDEAPQLYSYDASQDYSINVLPELNTPLTVPLGFSVGVSGNYSITASELNSFDQNILITLEDLKTSLVTDLRQNPVINFTATNTDDANRFLVHFGRSTTGIENTGNNDIHIYSSSVNIYIHSNGSEGNVYLYDMLGQQLTSEKLKSSTLNKLTVSTTGYYMVKVVTGKSVSVKKVLCII